MQLYTKEASLSKKKILNKYFLMTCSIFGVINSTVAVCNTNKQTTVRLKEVKNKLVTVKPNIISVSQLWIKWNTQ